MCMNDVRGYFPFFLLSWRVFVWERESYTFKYTPFNKIDENLPTEKRRQQMRATETLTRTQHSGTYRNQQHFGKMYRVSRYKRGAANANTEDTFAIPKCHLPLFSTYRRVQTLRWCCSFVHQVVAAWVPSIVQVPCYYNREKFISHIMAMCWFDRRNGTNQQERCRQRRKKFRENLIWKKNKSHGGGNTVASNDDESISSNQRIRLDTGSLNAVSKQQYPQQ